MDSFNIFCTLLGGLGIFYFGMKSSSEVFQVEFGEFIQKSMDSLSKNKIVILTTGTMLSSLAQSSQVVILTTLGLVNGGLMPLTTSLIIVLGANLGTTIMGHILAIPLDKLSLLLVGTSFIPTLFSNSHQIKQIGKMIFSIGLLFLGLQIISLGLEELSELPTVVHSINYFNSGTPFKSFLALLIGLLSTILLQSSVASIGILMTMASAGIIPPNLSLLLVIGINIGATIPPLLSSLEGLTNTRRVALGNFIFNGILGLIGYILIVLHIGFIHQFFNYTTNSSSPAFSVALAHTSFNLAMILIFLPFIEKLAQFLRTIIPQSKVKEIESSDLFSNDNIDDILPAMALYQINKEIKNFRNLVLEMFRLTDRYLGETVLDAKTFYKIKDFEKKTDSIQKEIANFSRKLSQHRLAPEQSLDIQRIVLMARELEIIADNLEKVAIIKTRFHHTIPSNHNVMDEILVYSKEVMSYFEEMIGVFDEELSKEQVQQFYKKAQNLKIEADTILEDYLQGMEKDEYHPIRDRFFSDITTSLRKIRSNTFSIIQSLGEKNEDRG